MKNILTIVLFIGSLLPCRGQKLSFFGYGRALVHNERLQGKITEGDTTHKDKSMSGYTLFDLGVKFHPYHHLRAHAIVRIKNQFGLFWGEGTSLTVRQFRFEGILAKVIKYEIGDLDMSMSPFTLHVPGLFTDQALPEVFRIRKEIQEYENYVSGDQRRLQGATAFSRLESKSGEHEVRARLLFARSLPDFSSGESKLITGGNLNYAYRQSFDLRINQISHYTLNQLKQDADISNHVFTAEYRYSPETGNKAEAGLSGEAGFSLRNTVFPEDPATTVCGSFLKAMIRVKKENFRLKAGILQVSPEFYSPGAQTTRFNYYQPAYVFPYYGNQSRIRKHGISDLFFQENILNSQIRTNLWPYYPQYDNVFPYGISTPDRSGILIELEAGNSENTVRGTSRIFSGKEIKGEYSDEKRKFFSFEKDLIFSMSRHKDWKKKAEFRSSLSFRQTARNDLPDSASVFLRTFSLTAGSETEVLKNFYLLTGLAVNISRGNEIMPLRDIFNIPYSYEYLSLNENETLFAFGMKYSFFASSFFTAQVSLSGLTDPVSGEKQAAIRQYYLNFTTRF